MTGIDVLHINQGDQGGKNLFGKFKNIRNRVWLETHTFETPRQQVVSKV
jgi:hypothetical protein